MKSTSELISEIRDFINSPRKLNALIRDKSSWNILCSSLDVVGDTEWAIDAYLNLIEPKTLGEKYLIVYGILQVLFVQQDSVENIAKTLNIEYILDSQLKEIRDIRNCSIGHPTEVGKGKASNFIVQMSLEIEQYQLLTVYQNDGRPQFKEVKIPSLINTQRGIIKKVLENIIDRLRQEEMEYRLKSRDSKLADFLPKDYFFGKISEIIRGTFPFEAGHSHLNLIFEDIEKFKLALRERDILEAYDSITYCLDELEYPLNKLAKYFEGACESNFTDRDAYIYFSYVRTRVDELRKIANEIDEETGLDL